MVLEILDNAFDSIKFAIEFYNKYLKLSDKFDETNRGYLKMTVFCVHHSVELLVKTILCNYNELLIVSDISSQKFLKLYSHVLHEHRRRSGNSDLLEHLTGEIDILTVDYGELISRFRTIEKLSLYEINTLNEIGRIRNKIMHVGYSKLIDFYEIIRSVNSTLEIIKRLLVDYACLNIKPENTLKRLNAVIERGKREEVEQWELFWGFKFDRFINIFLSGIESLNHEVKDYHLDYSYKSEDAVRFALVITNNGDKEYTIKIANLTKIDATVFYCEELDNRVLFVLDYRYEYEQLKSDESITNKNEIPGFFVFKKFYKFEQQDKDPFWISANKSGLAYVTTLNSNQLIRLLSELVIGLP